MAIPGLDALARRNGEAASVNQLVSTMHLARSEAITRNAQVTVCASRDGERCAGEWHEGWITFLDADLDEERDPDEALLARAPPVQGLDLHSSAFTRAMSYGADGHVGRSAAAAVGEFAFCAPGAPQARKVVIVRVSGLPALAATGADGAPLPCPEN